MEAEVDHPDTVRRLEYVFLKRRLIVGNRVMRVTFSLAIAKFMGWKINFDVKEQKIWGNLEYHLDSLIFSNFGVTSLFTGAQKKKSA
jgi:hypothetical protein